MTRRSFANCWNSRNSASSLQLLTSSLSHRSSTRRSRNTNPDPWSTSWDSRVSRSINTRLGASSSSSDLLLSPTLRRGAAATSARSSASTASTRGTAPPSPGRGRSGGDAACSVLLPRRPHPLPGSAAGSGEVSDRCVLRQPPTELKARRGRTASTQTGTHDAAATTAGHPTSRSRQQAVSTLRGSEPSFSSHLRTLQHTHFSILVYNAKTA